MLPDTLGSDLHDDNITRGRSDAAGEFFAAARAGKEYNARGLGAKIGINDRAFSLHYAISEMLAIVVPRIHVMVTSNAAKWVAMRDRIDHRSSKYLAFWEPKAA